MKMKQFLKTHKTGLLTVGGILLALAADSAFAGMASGLAWERPICMIAASLSGPVAKAVAVIIFVLAGLAMAAGEASGIMKTLIMTVFGLSLALMGAQWLGMLGAGQNSQAASSACVW